MFGFGAQFLYIGGAAIFMVDLLGQGELDFWKLFVPMIGSMMVGIVDQRSHRRPGQRSQARLDRLRDHRRRRRGRRRLLRVTAGDRPAVGDHRPEPAGPRQRHGVPVDPADDARPRADPPRRRHVVRELPGADLQRRGGGRAHAVRRHQHARTGDRPPSWSPGSGRCAGPGTARRPAPPDSPYRNWLSSGASRVPIDTDYPEGGPVRRGPGSPCSRPRRRRRSSPGRAR